MKNLKEYMQGYRTGARVVALIGLAAIAGGCNEEYVRNVSETLVMTGAQQAVASGVRNEIEGPRGGYNGYAGGRNSRGGDYETGGVKNTPLSDKQIESYERELTRKAFEDEKQRESYERELTRKAFEDERQRKLAENN